MQEQKYGKALRCAYSEAYTCPFVPMENWLEVPAYAGEKNYSLKLGH